MSAASLVVRVSADINDFARNLNKMTRDVDRAAKKIADVGKALTIGITLPVVAAAGALAKMAAENEDTAGRIQRVFGGMTDSIEGSITSMMKVIPEARTELEKMAISVDNMLQGMDVAPRAAAAMSESVLKLAGDLAAFNHVPMDEALQALEHGLAGKTKGLLEYGVAISEADIKQKAFAMGMLSSGRELTETGTALVAYQLIMERTARIQGEAGRTADQAGKQFAFFKRDISELADKVSVLVLPTMSGLARSGRDVVDGLSQVPDSITKVVFAVAGIAAVVGPALYGLSKLAQGYIAVKSAAALLTAGGGISGFLAGLTSPLGAVVVGIVSVTAALAGLYAIWRKFTGGGGGAAAGLANDPALEALIKGQAGAAVGGKNGATSRVAGDPLAAFTERASLVADAFESTVAHGGKLLNILTEVNAVHAQALAMLRDQGGAFTKEADTAQKVADQMQRIRDIASLANAAPGAGAGILAGIAGRPIDVGMAGATGAVDAAEAYRRDLAQRLAGSQYGVPFNAQGEAVIKSRGMVAAGGNDLALREALVGLPDGFDAARQAAVEYAEAQRASAEEVALNFERIRLGLEGFGLKLNGLGSGMQQTVVKLFDVVTSFAQGLASRLAGGGKNAGIGGGIGGMLTSALLGAKATSGFGPLGIAVGTIGGALIGGLFDHAKQATEGASSSLDHLATVADHVSESLSNLPAGFKIARERYEASLPRGSNPTQPTRPPNLPGGDDDGHRGSGNIVVNGNLVLQGVADVRAIVDKAQRSLNRGGGGFTLAASRA